MRKVARVAYCRMDKGGTAVQKAGTVEMNYEQMTEIINYIRAYPERFFESLEEYAISEYKPAWETLADYADWHSADFEEWRQS